MFFPSWDLWKARVLFCLCEPRQIHLLRDSQLVRGRFKSCSLRKEAMSGQNLSPLPNQPEGRKTVTALTNPLM